MHPDQASYNGISGATHRNLKARSWFRFWRRGQNFSLAERTSSRYLSLLFFLLAVVTLPQLYIWVSANLSRQLDGLVTDLTVRSAQLTTAFMPIVGVTLNAQQQDQAERIKGDADALAADARRALYYSFLLQRISSLGLNAPSTAAGSSCSGNDCDEWYSRYHLATELVQLAKAQALRAEINAHLISGIFLSFVLPILFGAIGAVAYVIRTISDQISSTTFSNSSPIRHVMRVMLGALMGAVIGLFVGLTAQLSLPPLALAFLAGYSVEAVFSMFDGLVARFRQPQLATAGQSQQGPTAAIVHQ